MEAKEKLIETISSFVTLVGRQLPDDVVKKLAELRENESNPLAEKIYDAMFLDLDRALALNRPLCQDTGVLQFFVTCGTEFPLMAELEDILREAVYRATIESPLRHNCVETFDEYNTGTNTGYRAPYVFWKIEPGNHCKIYAYMAGGGCTLPGKAAVLMPSEGYEGVVRFVLDVISTYGINACPPLLVGVGIATSVETAALLSKEALMRPVDSPNPNEKGAELERMLEEGLNRMGIGPQGLSGSSSVMGVNIENGARHPSAIGVAVNVGCWAHRRGCIVLDSDLNYEITTHKGAVL
jgi:L(+)-tartrate dehydratase alpha subunit